MIVGTGEAIGTDDFGGVIVTEVLTSKYFESKCFITQEATGLGLP